MSLLDCTNVKNVVILCERFIVSFQGCHGQSQLLLLALHFLP